MHTDATEFNKIDGLLAAGPHANLRSPYPTGKPSAPTGGTEGKMIITSTEQYYSMLLHKEKNKHNFFLKCIWLFWVLVAACKIFTLCYSRHALSCGMRDLVP